MFSVLLRDFFDVLYDEDVISEDAFYHWEHSSDPAEQAGKGVARTSVVQFFAWLREADEESQDDNWPIVSGLPPYGGSVCVGNWKSELLQNHVMDLDI